VPLRFAPIARHCCGEASEVRIAPLTESIMDLALWRIDAVPSRLILPNLDMCLKLKAPMTAAGDDGGHASCVMAGAQVAACVPWR
jgi:hypothetical protein